MKTLGVGELLGKSEEMLQTENNEGKKVGIGWLVTSYFVIAQMAGAGFLALPRGIADCGKICDIFP